MLGTPPTRDQLVRLDNWFVAPFNRWSLQHLREIMPTAPIAPAAAPEPLPRSEQELDGIDFQVRGERWTVGEMLDATYTDGFIVLQGGAVVTERYRNGFSRAGGCSHRSGQTPRQPVPLG